MIRKIHATYSCGMAFSEGGAVCGIKEPQDFASPSLWQSVTCGNCQRIILGKIDKWTDDRQKRYEVVCKAISLIEIRGDTIGTLGRDALTFLTLLKDEIHDEIHGGWWEKTEGQR